MSRYYSSSPLFSWLRKKVFKIEKPVALGWGKWEEWDAELKKTRPIAFFVTETLPEWIEWIPHHSVDYLNEVRIWVSNYRNNTHGLQSTLSKGKWHEFQDRVLYSNFDSFVDFVECEEASHHISWGDDEEKKKYKRQWYNRFRFFRWGNKDRCPEAGTDHLKWEMTLTEDGEITHQARSAVEKMTLYTWWKYVRPRRQDPWIDSGLRTFWDAMDDKYCDGDDKNSDWLGLGGNKKLTVEEQHTYNELAALKDSLEEKREEEDTEMLIRLIKIRTNLWT